VGGLGENGVIGREIMIFFIFFFPALNAADETRARRTALSQGRRTSGSEEETAPARVIGPRGPGRLSSTQVRTLFW
jgi:hypothetical protein